VNKENQEIKQQFNQANLKIRDYGILQASIQKSHRKSLTVEKSKDGKALAKIPKYLKYKGNNYLMEFDEYQK
jgi:hypothetical protein